MLLLSKSCIYGSIGSSYVLSILCTDIQVGSGRHRDKVGGQDAGSGGYGYGVLDV